MALYHTWLRWFNVIRVYSFFCGLMDHEKGVVFISYFHLIITVFTLALEPFAFSIILIYWQVRLLILTTLWSEYTCNRLPIIFQVMSFVCHICLAMGAKRKKIEYMLPWLVVIIMFLITGPFVMVWKYFDNIDQGRDVVAILILAVGYPWCNKVNMLIINSCLLLATCALVINISINDILGKINAVENVLGMLSCYFYVVVMSLFQRYSDVDDPIHPYFKENQRKKQKKLDRLAKREAEQSETTVAGNNSQDDQV